LWEKDGPGEEYYQRPDVEHLWKVDCGDMVVFVSENDSAVPDDERGEAYKE
jgi:hypothetical protein